ncbi:peptidoglycan DD-metalloendopeptidase family protein [Streptomyces sp. C11-1]|uniref:Peptidoglycan DD-metalloendopeptidase family protein n=1 Tax=Streptomyces durocortorensis TaxID=2811104 RepID=A0ABY9W4A8_9ACTN|nr:peptidoglycan DD-metalloendopeptidase family protein [Streptomyces durocortorensis]WNF29886.1 peptidoglycan DD-metalloendopeptidase family protein [Streptomyces durocortorensis]
MCTHPGRRRSPALRALLLFPLLPVFLLYVLLPAGSSTPGRAVMPTGAEASLAGAGADADADPDADGGDRSWPLTGRPTVLRGWQPPTGPYGPGHRGVDLAAGPGAPVLAAAGGRVSFAGRVAGRGVLAIEVGGSGSPPLRTTYEPVRALVEEGASVRAGQPVGALEEGPFHCAAGCLHWGLRRGDAYLDPLSLLPPSLLRRGPSRLLPVFGVPEPGSARAFRGVRGRVSRAHHAGPSRRRCRR